MTFLAAFFSVTAFADEQADVDKLLRQADEAGCLPAGVVVRVQAQMLWQAGTSKETQFSEAWEFTSDEVHRIVKESQDNTVIYRREKSLPFDSARLCHDLARGQMLKIRDNQGPGKRVRFALTDFDHGERSIEILVDSKPVIHLREAHWSTGYLEPHARNFATLYDKLASQARAAFAGFQGRDTLLKAAQSQTWPQGMVVRIGADIYKPDGGKFKEDWEFSERQVHRIVLENRNRNELTYRREESRELDTSSICQELIEGRAFEIQAGESVENGLLIADIENALGGRYIDVLISDEPVLELYEHCTGASYGVTQAHAFAKLYEKLASKARSEFAVSTTEK